MNHRNFIPAIVGPAPVSAPGISLPGSPPRLLQRFSLVIATGIPIVMPISGDFIYIRSISPSTTTEVLFGPTAAQLIPVTYKKRKIRFNTPFSQLQIQHSEAFTVTIDVIIGFGDYDENSPEGDIFVTVPAKAEDSYNFTRPNDAVQYAPGDVVSDSGATIPNFDALTRDTASHQWTKIVRLLLLKSSANVTAANFRIYFWTGLGHTANRVDNTPFTLLYADTARIINCVDMPAMWTEGAGSDCAISVLEIPEGIHVKGQTGIIRFEIIARDAYTPAAQEVFRLYAFAETY